MSHDNAAGQGDSPPALQDPAEKIGDLAAAAGIRRVDIVAWRDLDHPEAGGSELHAASIAERWASAGIEIRLTASRADGAAAAAAMDGYRVDRPAGRYAIFPSVAAARAGERLARLRERDGSHATLEVWNGMPFFSPLWASRPRLVFLHHVHDSMWDLVLPPGLARLGRFIEGRVAPPVYRRTPVVTLSESSRRVIIDRLGLHPDRVHVVEPGVSEAFYPGGARDPRPLVVAVGRLVPYKRFDRLIESLARLRARHPDLQAVIAGEGQDRAALEALVQRCDAGDWIRLPGRIDDDTRLDLYQRAWVLVSSSAYEGWGLTITEAAACGTPAVVSAIPGHMDAVEDGVTGFLAEPGPDMEQRIGAILSDPALRSRMQHAALRRAETFTWDRTALETMRILAAEAAP